MTACVYQLFQKNPGSNVHTLKKNSQPQMLLIFYFPHSLTFTSTLQCTGAYENAKKIYEIQMGICISIQIKYLNGIIMHLEK